jgi:hypothetical protein
MLVAVIPHRLEPERKTFGVTILAPGADLGATRHWIPRGFRPFDVRVVRHFTEA